MDKANSDKQVEKQEAIDEINRMLSAWQPFYCRYLLEKAERIHDAVTTPPPRYMEPGALDELRMGHVHIGEDGKPRCNNSGDYLRLRSIEEFKQLPILERCGTCNRLLAGKPAPWGRDFASLSDQQQSYIKAIAQRTRGAEESDKQDGWCLEIELTDDKSSLGKARLHRSLKRLELRGYVERMIDPKNRRLVRLTDRTDIRSEPSTVD